MSTDAPRETGAENKISDVLIRAEVLHLPDNDESVVNLRALGIGASKGLIAGLQSTHVADPAEVIGDIDAWHVRTEAGWHRFTAFMERDKPAREYQRPVRGGDIIASAPGPVFGIFGLGGARRAGFNDTPPVYSFHVLAPADDIGGVGLEGTANASPAPGFQRMSNSTRESALADTLLGWRAEAMRGLPLFLVRAETDSSVTLADLGCGRAYENLLVAMDNLCASAALLGRRARLLAVGIDHSLEDVRGTPAEIAAALRALLARIEREAAIRGLQRPVFLATFESGTTRINDHPSIRAHWELAWSHGPHLFAFSAPGYMFEQHAYGRPTDEARVRMAEMDAHALLALSDGREWSCPLFLLAEGQGKQIRVTAQAMADLVIDPADPFEAGPMCGLSLSGTSARIVSVDLAEDDARALILTCDAEVGQGAELRYAIGAERRDGSFPVNRGRVRDSWSAPSRAEGGPLHRWAYPAALAIRTSGQTGRERSAPVFTAVLETPRQAPAPIWLHARGGKFDLADGDPGRVTGWHSADGQVARSVSSNRLGTMIAASSLKFLAEINSGLVLEQAIPDLRAFSFGLVFQAIEGDARTLISLQAPGQAGYLFLDMLGGSARLAKKDGGLNLEVLAGQDTTGPMLVLCAISDGRAKLSINGADPIAVEMDPSAIEGAADLFIGCRGSRSGLRNKLGSFLLSDVFVWPEADCFGGPDDANARHAIALWQERQRDGI